MLIFLQVNIVQALADEQTFLNYLILLCQTWFGFKRTDFALFIQFLASDLADCFYYLEVGTAERIFNDLVQLCCV